MTTLQLIGAELSLRLPKLKHYGLYLGLCMLFVLTAALRPTELTTDNPITESPEKMTTATMFAAMMPQTIRIPKTSSTDTTIITDCSQQISFKSDSTSGVQYVDTAARNSISVICPQDTSRFLRFNFSLFDLEAGDTLAVYDGPNVLSPFIGSGSGAGNFQMNGGWVASNCDKTQNSSGCLTFVFKTDGDNAKGAGWEAWVTCEDDNLRIMPPANQFQTLACDDFKTPITVTAGNLITSCGLASDTLLVQIFNNRGTLCKDTCIRADSSFVIDTLAIGSYTVRHTLKGFPETKAEHYIILSSPALTCNDEVEAVFGASCLASIRPDYILENPCDTSANLYYNIVLKTADGSRVIKSGSSRNNNYPVVSKDDVQFCDGTRYQVEITRVIDYQNTCCTEGLIEDICWGYIKFVDGTNPTFMNHTIDTIMACGEINFDAVAQNLTKPNVVDNCDSITLKAIDNELIEGDKCADQRTYIITWEAADRCGNKATQKDTLRVLRPQLDKAIKLPDVVLSCGEDNPETMEDFERLGIVKIPMPGDTISLSTEEYVCNYILIKTDEEVPHPGGKKIARYWAVIDDCQDNPFPIAIDTQLIEFIDTLAPQIDCSPYETLAKAQTIPLPAFSCEMRVTLPKPNATDVCAAPTVEMYKVERLDDGVWTYVADNLGAAGELPCDTFRVGWQAIDISLEEDALRDSCEQYFILKDVTPPRVICGDEVQIAYDSDGTRLLASEVENQTTDDCELVKVEIRRKDIGTWGSFIDFTCADVHDTIKAELRFTDKGGNTNNCHFNVVILDLIPPYCADLPDFTGQCTEFHNDELGASTDANEDYAFSDTEWQELTGDLFDLYNNRFGNPRCEDNLACVPFSSQQQYQVIYAECGVVKARRRYRIIDWNGKGLASDWKIQEINITYTPGWSFTVPKDFFGECGDTVTAPNLQLDNGACDLLAWEHEDQIFDVVPDACYKVVRTYHIINWCNYVQGQAPIELGRDENIFDLVTEEKTFNYQDVADYGYFTYIQVLKVVDNEAPTISINNVETCIWGVGDADPVGVEDQTPGAAPYECDTVRIFSAEASDCEQSNFKNFSFTYKIYEDGVLADSGNTAKFFWTVQPKITYTVSFTTFDNCGNEATLTRDYEFWDCSRPSVICQTGYNVEIREDSTARLVANLLDKGSFDNCTPQSQLKKRIWHRSLSLFPPADKLSVLNLPEVLELGCEYTDTQQVLLYVLDDENNYDFCITSVFVGNNRGLCVPDTARNQAAIAGKITTMDGQDVADVMVNVEGNGSMPNAMTNTTGTYNFSLPIGQTYQLQPTKDDEPLNGVSTFDLIQISKHILGIQSFESPYEYIAADVNQSGTVTAFDLVQLRQLILNIIPEFPNNDSWRFVDATYEFTTSNPLTEPFREKIDINNHVTNKMDADFVAIKIGDLNHNATTNNLQQSEARTTRLNRTIDLRDRDLQVGQTYTVDFYATDLDAWSGYQFALDFTGLELIAIHEGLVKNQHFGTTLLDRNILLSSWDRWSGSEAVLTEQTPLFSLTFKAHTAGKLNQYLHLQPYTLPTEAYTEAGELANLELNFTTNNNVLTLAQNRPNPFTSTTSIGFQLPEAGRATLTVLDAQGRILLQRADYFTAGQHEWLIEGQTLTTKGLLYYQLATENEVLTKKMMLID
ncbi:MAG: hypothetical protein AAF960_18575 [Bacteroidota bacterium]